MRIAAFLIAGASLCVAVLAKLLTKAKQAPKEEKYTWDFYFRA